MRRPTRAAALLGLLVTVSALLRFWAGTLVPIPWITPDEIIYGELGRSLWHDGMFRILGRPTEFISLVYPALVGGPLSLGNLERGYHLLKLIQALVMSLAAVPAYLWARSLGARGWAFLAALLTVAIPGLAYSGLIMTEVAFYPVVLLAAWALAAALERPTLGRQALLVLACAAAAMTRLQAFVLLPAAATAVGIDLVLDRRRARLVLRLWPTAAGLVLLAAAWAGWRLRNGGALSRVFGAYEPAGQIHYGAGRAARFVLYHFADLALFTGFVPICAVLALLVVRDRADDRLRAYLASTLALCFWFPLEVGIFASQHVGYLAERNMLPLAPVLFVGFAAWLARGAPRPRVVTAASTAAVLALVAVLPLSKLAKPEAFPDSFTLLPVIRLHRDSSLTDAEVALLVVCVALLLAFVLLPRRLLVLLPLALVAGFGAISVEASNRIAFEADFLAGQTSGPHHRWIDERARAPVAYLYIGEPNWPAAWESFFWNRRVTHVYDLLTARIPGGLPQDSVGPLEDGRLVLVDGSPAQGAYVVSQYPVAFRGHVVGSAGDGFQLWRLKQPFRISVWIQRVAGHVRVLAYGCRPGRLRLQVVGAPTSSIDLRRNDRPYRRAVIPASGTWTGSIPAAPPRPLGTRLCTFDVHTPPSATVPVVKLTRP
jgi:Dolichyl-phosphate-mannose-protein mannosyltransferase